MRRWIRLLCAFFLISAGLANESSDDVDERMEKSSFKKRAGSNLDKMDVLLKWKWADYVFPSDLAKEIMVAGGGFTRQNVVILDVDAWPDERKGRHTNGKRIFATTPRFRPGIPATLSTVSAQRNAQGSFLLEPFPDAESQSVNNCDGPTSVYRIHIDKCGHLWVLDTGRIETFVNPHRVCQPKILIYDLTNDDRLITRHAFPNGVVTAASNLITLVTEVHGSCRSRDITAYIADVNGYALLVYDFATNSSWRVEHNYFYPFPTHGTINVAGTTFDLMDGIFGLAVGPPEKDRKLYFHAMASYAECWVPTSVLRNYRHLNASVVRSAFTMSPEARDSQSSLEVITDDGIMIFTLLRHNAIACWNVRTPYAKENIHIIYQSDENLQFTSGMKLVGDELWVTSSRLQLYIAGNLDDPSIKYRVVIGKVEKLLKASPCLNNIKNDYRERDDDEPIWRADAKKKG